MSEQLAVPALVIPPSDAEREACERLAQIGTEGCEEKAKAVKLKATLSLPTEPTPEAPIFIVRANADDVKKLEAEITKLREGQ